MRTISRGHTVLFLLSHSDAAVVTGGAAALAADVGRRVPVMLYGSGCAGRQGVGGKCRSWRRGSRSWRDGGHYSGFGHVVRPLLLDNDGKI